MDYYKIGGLALTAIIATIGLIKLELIKSVVSKITSGSENVNLFSIILLFLVSVVPTFFGFYSSDNTPPSPAPETEQISNKNNLEMGLEIGKAVLTSSKELYDEHKINKKREDSIFFANRPHKWVFRVGDLMDNDKSIKDLYDNLKNTDSICLFKDKNDFFLFKNTDCTKEQLDVSLDNFKSKIGSSVTIIDLMTYCRNSKEKLKMTKKYRLGKKKDKIKIECYIIER